MININSKINALELDIEEVETLDFEKYFIITMYGELFFIERKHYDLVQPLYDIYKS